MQVFEFYFNPKKKDRISDIFFYDPGDSQKEPLGGLYMVGELLNILPGKENFMGNLAKIIKKEYYSDPALPPEQAIEKALVTANEHLALEISRNNVSWLGNLNFAVISLSNDRINAARIGNTKIILIKNGKISDVSKDTGSVESSSKEYYPKAFGSMVSGRMGRGDRLAVLTGDLFDLFKKLGVIESIANTERLGNKNLESIIGSKKKELLKTSGALLLLNAEYPRINLTEKKDLEFSLKEVFSPVKRGFLKIFSFIKIFPAKPFKKKKSAENKTNIRFDDNVKKGLVLFLILAVILFFGFLIFQKDGNSNIVNIEEILKEAEAEFSEAETLIAKGLKQEAFGVLSEIWHNISDIESEEVSVFREGVESLLKSLSNFEEVSDPELIFEFNPREDLSPQKLILFGNNLYFFTSFSNKIVELNLLSGESREYFIPSEKGRGVNSAKSLNGVLVFFSKPNSLFSLKNGEIEILANLNEPDFEYSFTNFSTFGSSLYFWESESNEVIRYPDHQRLPEKWINPGAKKPTDIQSMSVDGSIWFLADNAALRYLRGDFVGEISPNVFPFPKRISHISTPPSFNRIFFLEPFFNRLIITDKEGRVIKQVWSDKFNNLTHFSVSQDGKRAYILDNLKVYRIDL